MFGSSQLCLLEDGTGCTTSSTLDRTLLACTLTATVLTAKSLVPHPTAQKLACLSPLILVTKSNQ